MGNVPYSTTEEELKDCFASRWTVVEARIVTDRDTGRSRGFGFVELESEEAAAEAIAQMDGHELGGRRLAVREAHERQGGRRPRRRHEERGPVAVDTVSRRGGGFRKDGPPRGRRGNGAQRYAAPPEPDPVFDAPDPFAPPPFDDGGKRRRRERRKRKKRYEDNEDW